YLYLSPWILGFLFFIGGPMVASLGLSFTEYRITSPPRFIGLENYATALFNDKLFWPSLGRTFYFAVVSVPITIVGSLALAVLLNRGLRGTTWFRTFFFLPHLTPIVAAALLWTMLLQPETGVVNFLLRQVGIKGPKWFGSVQWAIPGLILMSSWQGIGGNRMMIFLAGLQGVPEALYDASSIDGANEWQKFWNVTLPMISPTMFFNLVLGIINALRVFAAAMIATQGGPAYATWFFALHIYTQAFQYFEMGYASALAWFFLLVMLGFTYIQFRSASHWVYYEGEVRS
ncbi:MAG: sugar ABC transporter permease, partial [Chloroflexi bacterium]|nr:sugar ABC transporter permease [Chloroflexota bacterium]